MRKIIQPTTKAVVMQLIIRLTIDPFIVMLALGELAERLALPWLHRFGFFEVLLTVIIIQGLSASRVQEWEMTDES